MNQREQSDCESGTNFPLSWEFTAGQLPQLASEDLGLYLSDMPGHDSNNDSVTVGQQRSLEAPLLNSYVPKTTCANHDVGNWPGDYGFRALIENKETKNASCTYSATKRKLYVSMGRASPICFVTDKPPPPNSTVCVVAVFLNADLRHRTLRRCLVHAADTHESNVNHSFPDHWIRCDHPSTQYLTDDANGHRHCLTVPFEAPVHGDGHFTYRFRFMCNNSCVGGATQRQETAVFFILQSAEGEDLGRCVMEVKVCACPRRDRSRDEASRKRSAPSERKNASDGSSGAQRKNDRKKVYTVEVKDKKTYEFLSQAKEVLEIREAYVKKLAKKQAKVEYDDSD